MRTPAIALALGLALAACGTVYERENPPVPATYSETVRLDGLKSAPPNDSKATGMATISVDERKIMDIRLTVTGMEATYAQLHMGRPGADGLVILRLEKTGANTFASKPGAFLGPGYYDAFKSGNTYLNVLSLRFPEGEIRGQVQGR